ncbi:hypothetical protein [Sphingopyxis witflariensis]|uniref:Uncharacterized protein n=1 Tax=Sphingopyxis witflariensis TaxID=173675 RepID=A0A246K5X2_9SPHN|nr:hypothetical protein [Sphingopyxis witflariensis]OWR01397.1 hypothetical protein CDQ91_03100 [Sphingopyxis witflariensis]
MASVSELYVRRDWGFVKFAYVPAIFLLLGLKFLIPALAVVKIKFALPCCCGICAYLERWSEHVEEWRERKPILQATEGGLIHEDGGPPIPIAWHQVRSVRLVRRIAPWRTGGHSEWSPPYWLAIGYENDKGCGQITAWPREIVGGLFSLRRFARTLKLHLEKTRAARIQIGR